MKISIVVPLFEPDPKHLRQLLSSLFLQVRKPDEIVIVDDSSSGAAFNEIKHSHHMETLRYYKNSSRLGMAQNWNNGVRKTTGSHVLVLGQDDLLHPNALLDLEAGFQDNCTSIFFDRHIISNKLKIDCNFIKVNDRSNIFRAKRQYFLTANFPLEYLILRNGNILGELPCQIFTKKIFQEVGGYPIDLQHANDLLFAYNIARNGYAKYLNKKLLYRRIDTHNLTKIHVRDGKAFKDKILIYDTFLMKLTLPQRAAVDAAMLRYALYLTYRGFFDLQPMQFYYAIGVLKKVRKIDAIAILRSIRELLSKENMDAQ